MVSADTWIPLAEVARPHGVRGELRLKLFNKDSDVLLERDEVLVRLPDGEEHEVSVDGARRADDAILMKLFSIDDRDRADEVRGALICVRRRDFPPLEDGEFYACDVEGMNVLLAPAEPAAKPTPIGKVKELRNYPSIDAFIVQAADGGKDWEIPLVDVFVASIDVAAGVVTLKTIDGLERS